MATLDHPTAWEELQRAAVNLFPGHRACVYRVRGVYSGWVLDYHPLREIYLGETFQEAYTALVLLAVVSAVSPPPDDPADGQAVALA